MACRPLAFGIRFRDRERTVRLSAREREPRRYVVEDSRAGKETRRREHASLCRALQDFAVTWRHRLH